MTSELYFPMRMAFFSDHTHVKNLNLPDKKRPHKVLSHYHYLLNEGEKNKTLHSEIGLEEKRKISER